MKGYKVFKPDWTCRDFKYEVGKTYEMEEKPIICEMGFHFCRKITDCFSYYYFDRNNKVAEIEAIGDIDGELSNGKYTDSKLCTNKISILRELSWEEVLELCNTGRNNTGLKNTGNYNSGNFNTGNYNSGENNTGSFNSGHNNTGCCNIGSNNVGSYNYGSSNVGCNNIGSFNTGEYNSGNHNTGNFNSGNHNTGNFNIGSYNTGFFNTTSPKVRLFNHETNYKFNSPEIIRLKNILSFCKKSFKCSQFFLIEDMTLEEKNKFPNYEITKGCIREVTVENDKLLWWENLPEEDKEFIKSLPYYDEDIFFKCMGIERKDRE